jgi:hypothetical protein
MQHRFSSKASWRFAGTAQAPLLTCAPSLVSRRVYYLPPQDVAEPSSDDRPGPTTASNSFLSAQPAFSQLGQLCISSQLHAFCMEHQLPLPTMSPAAWHGGVLSFTLGCTPALAHAMDHLAGASGLVPTPHSTFAPSLHALWSGKSSRRPTLWCIRLDHLPASLAPSDVVLALADLGLSVVDSSRPPSFTPTAHESSFSPPPATMAHSARLDILVRARPGQAPPRAFSLVLAGHPQRMRVNMSALGEPHRMPALADDALQQLSAGLRGPTPAAHRPQPQATPSSKAAADTPGRTSAASAPAESPHPRMEVDAADPGLPSPPPPRSAPSRQRALPMTGVRPMVGQKLAPPPPCPCPLVLRAGLGRLLFRSLHGLLTQHRDPWGCPGV